MSLNTDADLIKKEYEGLVKTIKYHMDLYYNQDEPEISDYEYDMLMQRLKEIEKEHPEFVKKDSPSKIVGGVAKREAGVKITHNVPMLSIEDVFSKEEVVAYKQLIIIVLFQTKINLAVVSVSTVVGHVQRDVDSLTSDNLTAAWRRTVQLQIEGVGCDLNHNA